MSISRRAALTRPAPWYAACILVPIMLGWSPQQILLLVPAVVVIVIITRAGQQS